MPRQPPLGVEKSLDLAWLRWLCADLDLEIKMKKVSRTSLNSVSQWHDPGRVERLVELAKAGVIYAEIARQLGTTVSCVKGKLKAMGVKRKHLSHAGTGRVKRALSLHAIKTAERARDKAAISRDLREATGNISAPRRFSWENDQ